MSSHSEPTNNASTVVMSDLEDSTFTDIKNALQSTKQTSGRCKNFIVQSFALSTRISALLDIVTDSILLYKASHNHVIELTMALFLSMICPYVLSYSSGIKLFIYRKTFDNLVGFKNIFLILYLLPTGVLYFMMLDIIDIFLVLWIWISYNMFCRSQQYIKDLQSIIASQLGMDKMNFEGLKRQKSISQICFETIPQLILQLLLASETIPGKDLAQITTTDLQISIATAVFNLIAQITKLYIESVAVDEYFVEYCLNAMMARISWFPFRLKIVQLTRTITYADTQLDYSKDAKHHKKLSCCDALCSVYYRDPSDDERTINYDIKYRIPIISWLSSLCSNNELLVRVEYDFSSVTITHLIATINQISSTSERANIQIKFSKSLKLLGVREIINVMEACKMKNILLPDIAENVVWKHAFLISSTINENDPRLATFCNDYNDRPLLISMYKSQCDTNAHLILNAFLENDCPVNLKDSNNETIIYHMIRNNDHKAIRMLFAMQKIKNCEISNLNIYNKAGHSLLFIALQQDLKRIESNIKNDIDVDEERKDDHMENNKVRQQFLKQIWNHLATIKSMELWKTSLFTAAAAYTFDVFTVLNIMEFKLNYDALNALKVDENHEMDKSRQASIYFLKDCIKTEEKISKLLPQFEEEISRLQSKTGPNKSVADDGLKTVAAYKFITAAVNANALHSPLIHVLLEHGADVNFSCVSNTSTSCLGYILKLYFGSVSHEHIIHYLLERGAKLFHDEIHILPQLFIHAASKRMDSARDECFSLLEAVTKNSSIALQNIVDSEGNTSIHTAIIVHNLKTRSVKDRKIVVHKEKYKHIAILSALCKRYPTWMSCKNYGGDYALYIASKEKDIDSTFCLLKHIAAADKNASFVHLNDFIGNPIHIAITQHEALQSEESVYCNDEQHFILSQLCEKYPFWIKTPNADDMYPLILSVKMHNIASTFCLLSFLLGTDTDSMYQMMRKKSFVQNMILWMVEKASTSVIKLFLDIFKYEDILKWPQALSVNKQSPPISLVQYINNKPEDEKRFLMNQLKNACDIEKYAASDLLAHKIDLTNFSTIHIPLLHIDDDDSEEEMKNIEQKDNDSDSETRNSSASADDKHEKKNNDDDNDKDIVVFDEEKPVNWIELLYSTLVESFSTADLYTDVVIMIDLYEARQQWWVIWMLFLVIAPYLVSYSALGSIVQHRIQSRILTLDESGESVGCCRWFVLYIGIFILMTPLCLMYFIVIDVVFMMYVILSTVLFIISCSKLDIRDFVDDMLFKKAFGMNKTQIIGYRRLRTLSQLCFETFLQVLLQLRILYDVRWSGKKNVAYSITEEAILWSIFFALCHFILEAVIIHLDSRALKMEFTKYAIVCLGARVGWIPYSHLIEKRVADKSTETDVMVYNYDKIDANIFGKKYNVTYTFSNEYLETFAKILGALSPRSLSSTFYSSPLCNPMLESLFKNVLLNTKIKFGPVSCRDINVIALAEFYHASVNKVDIDISEVDGTRIVRNTYRTHKKYRKVLIDSLIKHGLIGCADWMKRLDFVQKTEIKQSILENALKTRSDVKYARFDIIRSCLYIGTDCETVQKIYSYLQKYLKIAQQDPSYFYVAIFLLYYTSGTVFNHKCNKGCHKQDLFASQIQQYLPKKVVVDGLHSIPIQLIECFHVFNVYFEELLLDVCKNAIISGKLSSNASYALKLRKEHFDIEQYLKQTPSSLYRKLLRAVTKRGGIIDPAYITDFDKLTKTLQMTDLYGVYLRKSLSHRKEEGLSDECKQNSKLSVSRRKSNDGAELNSFPLLSRDKDTQISKILISITIAEFYLDDEDICRCVIYFNHKNKQLNNIIFYDQQIENHCNQIIIDLNTSSHAFGYYNQALLSSFESEQHPKMFIELIASSVKSDENSVAIVVETVKYFTFHLFGAQSKDDSKDDSLVLITENDQDGVNYAMFQKKWNNLLEAQNYKECETLCHNNLAKSPLDANRSKLYNHLGYLYENFISGKTFDDILEHYVLALQVDESNADAHFNLANFTLEQAMQHILRCLEIKPNHKMGGRQYANITPVKTGVTLILAGYKYRVEEVADDEIKAIRLRKQADGTYETTREEPAKNELVDDPLDTVKNTFEGEHDIVDKEFVKKWDVLIGESKYKEAEKLCHEALAESPLDKRRSVLYNRLGYLYENYLDDKTFDDILEHYVLSLQVDESNANAHYHAGHFFLQQGMQHLLRALELDPNHNKANKLYSNFTPIKTGQIVDLIGRKYKVTEVEEYGVKANYLAKQLILEDSVYIGIAAPVSLQNETVSLQNNFNVYI